MAMSVTFTNVLGQVLMESRGGVDTEFIPDPLGNVVKCKTSSVGFSYSAEYWPYGEIQTSTGSNPSNFGYVGTWGYYQDGPNQTYVRARYYKPVQGRWMTVDPLWPGERAYGYGEAIPVQVSDPSGLQGQQCLENWGKQMEKGIEKLFNDIRSGRAFTPKTCRSCALALLTQWGTTRTHDCHHAFTHCMACCVLNDSFGPDCAIQNQHSQNFWQHKDKRTSDERLKQCRSGLGKPSGKSCDEYCRAKHGTPNNLARCKDQRFPGVLPIPDACKPD